MYTCGYSSYRHDISSNKQTKHNDNNYNKFIHVVILYNWDRNRQSFQE